MTCRYNNRVIHSGGIYGVLQTLRRLQRDFLEKDGTFWVLFDNAKSKKNMRREIYDSEYKANRKSKPESFYRGLEVLQLILLNYKDNYKMIYQTMFEADDLVPAVINCIPEEEDILAVSDDLDWSRVINYNGRPVDQYMKNEIYDSKLFEETYGFKPTDDKIILFKVIRGDKIDNIPIGIRMLPLELLLQLLEDYKDIFDVIDNIRSIKFLSDKWKKKIIENEKQLRINHQLVDFIPISTEEIMQSIHNCKYNPTFLEMIYEALSFDAKEVDYRLYDYMRKKHQMECFFRKPG
jgi:5'-3' exonuclease